MNTKILSHIIALSAALAVGMGFISCKEGGSHQKDPNVDYFTCTMHPSVKSQKPDDKCPICSMDLVPVMKKGAPPKAGESGKAGGMEGMPGMKEGGGTGETHEFVVPIERQQQVGVTYAAVERKPLQHTIRAVGSIVPDRGRRWEFVARVEGYVQKLHVTSPGELVAKDQPLLSIYSPDLFASEREFVELLKSRDKIPGTSDSGDRLLESARRRLELWNITPEQVAELEKSRQPTDTLNLLSPFRGIVEKVAADQGKKVMVGESLVSVVDLSVVWLWAEFYENELAMVHQGQTLDITATSYPGKKFKGTISLINPFIEEMKRTAKVRVDIANEDFLLRPGMYVNAELAVEMGEGLIIPVGAIMPTGLRSYVFVDKKEGKLEPRLVQLGPKYGEFYEVQSGLAEGERVVTSANFLIDAESKVQGALKGFEEPAAGEPAPVTPTQANAVRQPMPVDPQARSLFEPVLEPYLVIQKQLAKGRFEGVPEQAAKLREQVEVTSRPDIKPPMHSSAWIDSLRQKAAKFQPANLEEARVQFGELSLDLVKLITQSPPTRSVRGMHCPMWKKSPGYWIQEGKETENPFMGPAMLTCGSEVKSLAEIK